MRIFLIKKRNLYIAVGVIIALIIGAIFFTAVTRDRTVSSQHLKYAYRNLLPEEANDLITNNPHVLILDVRSPEDYTQGHLHNALSVPYKELKGQLDEFAQENTYLVYSQSGKESTKAAKLLSESGFPRVFTLVGGYHKWPYGITKVSQ
ncbi:Rhodanese domain protein [Alkaliphilus metalliredigens QYMF]|uniref:Rhodanese domain protein n=1 Tax=Alkaliphilus metalliredigens (strain QYMF) TaxID=293826 RepID=A6TJL2_ALKMQ|nr:rhodanese-like domain-containing protein [Alkaliphilus metalliredigens]ABR46380.1 Rhodanese domain protein [Alkaliphilus metalliredigens QYMF]